MGETRGGVEQREELSAARRKELEEKFRKLKERRKAMEADEVPARSDELRRQYTI